ncbi:MAG: hypothetical protein ABI782_02805 [Anaerolineaceae bacterium]
MNEKPPANLEAKTPCMMIVSRALDLTLLKAMAEGERSAARDVAMVKKCPHPFLVGITSRVARWSARLPQVVLMAEYAPPAHQQEVA